MDHDETREQLELAALEPGGLDRLMAGDTPAAQAVAGHLAGCDACTDELVRLRRSSAVIRSGLSEMPPPDLKERTLATIRAEGVQRPLAAAAAPIAVMPLAAASSAGEGTAAPAKPAVRGRGRSALPMIVTIAAAIVLSVVTTSLDRRLARGRPARRSRNRRSPRSRTSPRCPWRCPPSRTPSTCSSPA